MTEADPKQWRIDNASHLRSVRLQWSQYSSWSETWDHDHCAACFAKFAASCGPETLHHGYATCDDYKRGARYEWVCRDCFDDLKDEMGWVSVPGSSPPSDAGA